MSNFTVGTIFEFISNFLKIDNNQNLTTNDSNVAYGGGMAGNKFNLLNFIKRPQVIFRVISVFFSIIVFGCISADSFYQNEGKCPLNEDDNACNFGITIGVIAFLASLIFLIIDAKFENFSNIKTRRRIVISDLVFSAVWSFFWFVTFCYLADAWRKTNDEIKEKADSNKIQASIAFSFFSTLIWIAIALLNFLRYRQGIANVFGGYEDPNQQYNNSSTIDSGPNDLYRQAPFNTNANANSGGGGYQQPNY